MTKIIPRAALLALLSIPAASAITITEVLYTGQFSDGVTVAFESADQFSESVLALGDGLGTGSGDSFPQTIGFLAPGVDLLWGFNSDGDNTFRQELIPAGWVALTPSFIYNPVAFAGAVTWTFSPVPDMPATLGLLGVALAGLSILRRQR